MARHRICNDARQLIFNVFLYFEGEANRFKKIENGYFQKVQERVASACCVSKKFVHNLLKEEKFQEDTCNNTPQPIGKGRRKRFCEDHIPDNEAEIAIKELQDVEPRPIRKVRSSASMIQTRPSALTPLLTPELPQKKPMLTEPKPPPLAPIAINYEIPPPLTPIAMKPEIPPRLTPFVKFPMSPPPQLVTQPTQFLHIDGAGTSSISTNIQVDRDKKLDFRTKTVPIEYDPLDIDSDVKIKHENADDESD